MLGPNLNQDRTMQSTHNDERDPDLIASAPPLQGLPFEYEDRSDGRYTRAIEEAKAAWMWIQSRRAHGFLPN
jgi:hypothetical protein